MKRYSIILFLLLFSCEDIITPNLPTNEPILVVDAWINDKETTQQITLSKTQDYLDDSSPSPATGADVVVYDDKGNSFDFIESTPGNYTWTVSYTHLTLPTIE